MAKPQPPTVPATVDVEPDNPESLARRFLDACAEIEETLQRKYDLPRAGLGSIVRQAEPKDAVVRHNRRALDMYVGLRNVMSHTAWQNGEPIASPLPETVTEIERLAEQIERPVRALSYATRTPLTAQATDSLKNTLTAMAQDDISQVPVYGDDVGVRLLTTNAIARWVSSHINAEGTVHIEKGTLADALAFSEGHERLEFVKKSASAADAIDRLTKVSPPAALVITEHGRSTEGAIGIVVAADLPKLVAAVTVSID